MVCSRWQRLVWAIAAVVLAGTPAVRAFCAATCEAPVVHAGHAAPAVPAAAGHEHGHRHDATAAPAGDAPIGAAAMRADARSCDGAAVAAATSPRAAAAAAPPVPFLAHAPTRPLARDARLARRSPLRPPGGAAAPLPLRV